MLPVIEGKDEFVVIDKGDYCAIDYLVQKPDTFSGDPILLECRGIKFHSEGWIMARPFHKFFNIGERERVEDIDWNQSHMATEKLDGSMVHATILNAKLVFMTRKGITDIALDALKLASEELKQWCWERNILDDLTPIFEYTGPKNRIVILYPEPKLTLIGMRNKYTGEYCDLEDFDHGHLNKVGTSPVGHIDEFIAFTRSLKKEEGFVISFPSTGHMVKIKAEDYVLKHKVKSEFAFEKNVLRLVLLGQTDDLFPLLEEEEKAKLRCYEKDVWFAMSQWANAIKTYVEVNDHLTQKEFAVLKVVKWESQLRGILFRCRKGGDAFELLKEHCLKNCFTSTRVESIRGLIKANWDETEGEENE